MKKIFTIMALLLILQHHVSAQVTFGVSAGIISANYAAKESGVRMSPSRKTGFTVGSFVNVPIAGSLYFQPGLNFVQKGYVFKDNSDPAYAEKNTNTVNCIEIPLNMVYRTNGNSNGFMFGVGPSLAFAVSGKDKYESAATKETTKLKIGNGIDDDLRGFDLGGNIIAGVQLKSRIVFAANYNFGFSNLIPKGDSDTRLTSNYFGVRVGYVFK